LLAILLRTGIKGKNAVELADEFLKEYTLDKLMQLSLADIKRVKGIDSSKACTLLASFELARRALQQFNDDLPLIESAQDAVDQLVEYKHSKKEHFIALYLNTRNHLLHKEVISVGTVNASIVHPREVFEPAIKHTAVQIILAHNHPSGNPEPSDADLQITRRLREVGDIMGIHVIDHVICVKNGYFSFKDRALL
jgi:DNA repair protein RadC